MDTSKRSKVPTFFSRIGFPVWRKLLMAASLAGATGLLGLSRLKSEITIQDNATEPGITVPIAPYNVIGMEPPRAKNFFRATQATAAAEDYCSHTRCESITCSFVPVQFDPGAVASRFIDTEFKTRCSAAKRVQLTFRDCKFASNRLVPGWLKTNVPIDELSFRHCSLNEIADDAFSGAIYEDTRSLVIVENRISSLRRATFRGLTKLQRLTVQDNRVLRAERDLLAICASSLNSLQLDNAISDASVLANITGAGVLSNVQLLSIRDNSIPVMGRDIFEGVPNVRSLYADRSGVGRVIVGAFEPMAARIEQLFMSGNSIVSLPEGLFDSIVRPNRRFGLSLENNPWRCDCALKWLQDLVRNRPSVITVTPVCASPEENASLTFLEASFCNETDAESTSCTTQRATTPRNDADGQDSSTTTEKTTEETVTIACDNINAFLSHPNVSSVASTIDQLVLQYFSKFSLVELENGSVMVYLPRSEVDVALLWFENDILSLKTDSCKFKEGVRCLKNPGRNFVLRDVRPSTRYTVCLLDDGPSAFSPLNCQALVTKPRYENRAWLTNGDKAIVLPLLSFCLILLCSVGALFMFFAVRRHPTLLRGSKRVLMVKRRSMDAIVLPKGVEGSFAKGASLDNIKRAYRSKSTKEDGYATPVPVSRPTVRKDSRVSGMSLQSSGASYVSGIEPTLGQLASWRLKRLKSAISSREANLPPVPPHPKHNTVPSVSMTVDAKDSVSEDLFYIV